MKRVLLFLVLPLLTAVDAAGQARGMGGCARNAEQGYVTATRSARPVYLRAQGPLGTVEPGDELRLCRYEGANAIITVWTHGYGIAIPRSAVGELREEPTLREVTEQDIACIGREIDNIQRTYRAEQDWKMLELARQHDVSLSMIAEIRMASGRRQLRGESIPACSNPN